MASFDFITDEDFRTSLENDFKEMNLCIQAGAYKAAVVISGSIIETVLIDYVIAENILARENALKLDFGKVLSVCKEKGIISDKTLDLSTVIKGYRNLIHPGRAIRLNENADKDTADVSKALVNMVLGEVEKRKKENYGFTAEQIVSKLENDSSAISIIPHLLDKVNPKEIERLLLKVLPKQYVLNYHDIDYSASTMESLSLCFRTAFEGADESTKKKVAEWLVKMFTEGPNEEISTYGFAFFRAKDLSLVSGKEASLIKQYLLGRLKNNVTIQILDTTKGIGKFLEAKDVVDYVDPLVKSICQNRDSLISEKAQHRLINEVYADEIQKIIIDRISRLWLAFYKRKNQLENAEKLETVIVNIELPF
jgi:hypothetical protein